MRINTLEYKLPYLRLIFDIDISEQKLSGIGNTVFSNPEMSLKEGF